MQRSILGYVYRMRFCLKGTDYSVERAGHTHHVRRALTRTKWKDSEYAIQHKTGQYVGLPLRRMMTVVKWCCFQLPMPKFNKSSSKVAFARYRCMQYGVNRGELSRRILVKMHIRTVKFHVVCLRLQTRHKHTLTSMHPTGAALAANLHHPCLLYTSPSPRD